MSEEYSLPQREGLPNWLAGLVIALALAGAGWFAWTNLIKSDDGRVVAIREGPARGGRPQRASAPQRPRFSPTIVEGVARSPFGRSIYARVGDAAVRGIPDNDGKAWDVMLEYFDERTWVAPDQWRLVEQARIAMSLPHRGKEVGLTAQQKAKLDELNKGPQLSEAEKGKLIPLFAEWHGKKEQRDQLKPQMMAAAGELTGKYREAAKAAVVKFAGEIAKVLSAEQVNMLKEGTRPPKPQTRPVI